MLSTLGAKGTFSPPSLHIAFKGLLNGSATVKLTHALPCQSPGLGSVPRIAGYSSPNKRFFASTNKVPVALNISSENGEIFGRIAVVGAGPAGLRVAQRLLQNESTCVHIFEQSLVPLGLVRNGVAPDHPDVRMIARSLIRELSNTMKPRLKFFGGVTLGKDISLDTLRKTYDCVVLATGGASKKSGLSGAVQWDSGDFDKNRCFTSRELVAFYNGSTDGAIPPSRMEVLKKALNEAFARPDGCDLVIIGQGNVALDLARVLAKIRLGAVRRSSLSPMTHSLLAGTHSRRGGRIRIHICGRRGALQSAWSNSELRELINTPGLIVRSHPEEMALSLQSNSSQVELASSRVLQKRLAILKRTVENNEEVGMPDTSQAPGAEIWLRYLVNPVGRKNEIELQRRRLEGPPFAQQAIEEGDAGSNERLRADLVIESFGDTNSETDDYLNDQSFKNALIEEFNSSMPDSQSHNLTTDALVEKLLKYRRRGLLMTGHPQLASVYGTGWLASGGRGNIASTLWHAETVANEILSSTSAGLDGSRAKDSVGIVVEDLGDPVSWGEALALLKSEEETGIKLADRSMGVELVQKLRHLS